MFRFVLLFVLIAASNAAGQEVGRVEASLDYSYMRLNVPNSRSPVNLHGIQLGAAANLNRWLGVGADFGTYYHCAAGCWGDTSLARNYVFTFLAGPRFRFRPHRDWRPFAQASAGVMNIRYSDDVSVSPSPTGVGVVNTGAISSTGMAITAGGGLDWVKGRAILRAGQLDLLHYQVGGQSGNTVRFSMGVRLQLGMPTSRIRHEP